MSELIHKQDVVDIWNNPYLLPETKYRIILALEPVEAEEVVHCSECKHKYLKDMNMYCPTRVSALRPNGHCEQGERSVHEE